MKGSYVKLQPIDNRVIVLPEEVQKQSAGGIILPAEAQEKPYRGRVVAVGPGVLLDDGTRAGMQVKVGDLVIFGKHAGAAIDDYTVLRENDIFAIVVT